MCEVRSHHHFSVQSKVAWWQFGTNCIQLSFFWSQTLFSCFGLPNPFTLCIKPLHMLASSVFALQLPGTPQSGCFWMMRKCFAKECWGWWTGRYLLGSTDRDMYLIKVLKREPFPMLAHYPMFMTVICSQLCPRRTFLEMFTVVFLLYDYNSSFPPSPKRGRKITD